MTIRRVQIIAETVRKLVIPVTAVVFLIETILWQGSLNRPEKMQSRRATRLTADRNSVRMEKAGRVVQILTRHSVPWKRTIRIREARVQKWKAAQIIWMQFAATGQRNDAAEADQEQNTGASQVQDLRSDDRPSQDLSALDSGQEACGILEVMTEGFGFIRSDNFMSGDNDVYVSPSQIRRFGLRTGDMISGNTRIKTMQEKYSALLISENNQRHGTVRGDEAAVQF